MSTLHVCSACLALVTATALLPVGARACATCGCTLSTDAAMGYSSDAGWHLSLQYDFINQNQLRVGTHAITAAQVAAINDAGGDQEVEHKTTNRYTTLGIGYAPDADWNLRLFVPYIDRGHSTYASATNPVDAAQLSGSTIKGLGDMRFIASWQGLLDDKRFGVQLGIKAPTGHYGGPAADGSGVVGRHPTAFSSGPLSQHPSPDNLVDTSLQPGTGSTDLIVGAGYHRDVAENVDVFVNGQFQGAVSHRLDQPGQDFRPGNTATVTVGVRYEAHPSFTPQLQVNVYRKSRDQGALADNPDSAGTVVYLAPGATVALAQNLQAFGFVQVPAYRNLVGYQLAPRWTASAGIGYSF